MTDDEYRRRTPYQIEMEREARKLRTLREVIESTEARCVRIETRLTGIAIALKSSASRQPCQHLWRTAR